jgi:hypothetical protein
MCSKCFELLVKQSITSRPDNRRVWLALADVAPQWLAEQKPFVTAHGHCLWWHTGYLTGGLLNTIDALGGWLPPRGSVAFKPEF